MDRRDLIKTLAEVEHAFEKRVCANQKTCHDCPLLVNGDCTIAALRMLISYLEERA